MKYAQTFFIWLVVGLASLLVPQTDASYTQQQINLPESSSTEEEEEFPDDQEVEEEPDQDDNTIADPNQQMLNQQLFKKAEQSLHKQQDAKSPYNQINTSGDYSQEDDEEMQDDEELEEEQDDQDQSDTLVTKHHKFSTFPPTQELPLFSYQITRLSLLVLPDLTPNSQPRIEILKVTGLQLGCLMKFQLPESSTQTHLVAPPPKQSYTPLIPNQSVELSRILHVNGTYSLQLIEAHQTDFQSLPIQASKKHSPVNLGNKIIKSFIELSFINQSSDFKAKFGFIKQGPTKAGVLAVQIFLSTQSEVVISIDIMEALPKLILQLTNTKLNTILQRTMDAKNKPIKEKNFFEIEKENETLNEVARWGPLPKGIYYLFGVIPEWMEGTRLYLNKEAQWCSPGYVLSNEWVCRTYQRLEVISVKPIPTKQLFLTTESDKQSDATTQKNKNEEAPEYRNSTSKKIEGTTKEIVMNKRYAITLKQGNELSIVVERLQITEECLIILKSTTSGDIVGEFKFTGNGISRLPRMAKTESLTVHLVSLLDRFIKGKIYFLIDDIEIAKIMVIFHPKGYEEVTTVPFSVRTKLPSQQKFTVFGEAWFNEEVAELLSQKPEPQIQFALIQFPATIIDSAMIYGTGIIFKQALQPGLYLLVFQEMTTCQGNCSFQLTLPTPADFCDLGYAFTLQNVCQKEMVFEKFMDESQNNFLSKTLRTIIFTVIAAVIAVIIFLAAVACCKNRKKAKEQELQSKSSGVAISSPRSTASPITSRQLTNKRLSDILS